MNIAIVIYLVVGTPIAGLVIGAAAALLAHSKRFRESLDSRQRGERLGLRLLLAQTLIPVLQFIADLNTTVTHRPGPLLSFCLIFLAIAAMVLFPSTEILLLANARGSHRFFLPFLSSLAFLFSTALVLALGATA